jgi:hypothetical protein
VLDQLGLQIRGATDAGHVGATTAGRIDGCSAPEHGRPQRTANGERRTAAPYAAYVNGTDEVPTSEEWAHFHIVDTMFSSRLDVTLGDGREPHRRTW